MNIDDLEHLYPWKIQYTIFPLDTIFVAYANSDYSEHEARTRFKAKIPNGHIQAIKRTGESIPQLI